MKQRRSHRRIWSSARRWLIQKWPTGLRASQRCRRHWRPPRPGRFRARSFAIHLTNAPPTASSPACLPPTRPRHRRRRTRSSRGTPARACTSRATIRYRRRWATSGGASPSLSRPGSRQPVAMSGRSSSIARRHGPMRPVVATNSWYWTVISSGLSSTSGQGMRSRFVLRSRCPLENGCT